MLALIGLDQSLITSSAHVVDGDDGVYGMDTRRRNVRSRRRSHGPPVDAFNLSAAAAA